MGDVVFGTSKFEGVVLDNNQGAVRYRHEGGPVAGAHATVDTAGEIASRFTATRLLLLGPLALAFKKKKDQRELYLCVEGQGFAFAVEVPPKKGAEARKFAAALNSAASKAALTSQTTAAVTAPSPLPVAIAPPAPRSSPPASWYADPSGGTGMRWWDGAAWTDHVQKPT